jgi:hypothetical protein
MKSRYAMIILTLASACALLLSGCGGKSGTGTGTGAGPGEAVRDFYESLLNGDYAEAYEMLSSAARGKISYEQFEAGMKESRQEAPIDEGTQVEIISEEIDGDTATVRASIRGSEGDIGMVRENGAWKIDD